MTAIVDIHARQILDSRGNPTVEVEILTETGERSNFKVMIGGGPVTGGYADEIGSDGYGKDAVQAVEIAKRLTGIGPTVGSGESI